MTVAGADDRAEGGPAARSDQYGADGRVVFDVLSFQTFNQCLVVRCPNPQSQPGALFVAAGGGGGTPGQITPGILDYEPRWSAASNTIVYLHGEGSSTESARSYLQVVTPEGKPTRPRIDIQIPVGGLAVSPDGSTAAVSREKFGATSNPEIALIDLVSGAERTLIAGARYGQMMWSPDGTSLVTTRRTKVDERFVDELVVVTVADGRSRVLVKIDPPLNRTEKRSCSGSVPSGYAAPWIMSPNWSPDGRQIAFTSNAAHMNTNPQVHDIVIINADGSELRTVRAGREGCDGGGQPQNEYLDLVAWRNS